MPTSYMICIGAIVGGILIVLSQIFAPGLLPQGPEVRLEAPIEGWVNLGFISIGLGSAGLLYLSIYDYLRRK